ncbi:MAG: carbohydrate kinase family protein [Treponema sp.]|nr:carbohydrate kinase family protein [Treponema sp.]
MNIHGAGCDLLDCIYADEDFSSAPYRDAMSARPGDGGLAPGGLVFSSALETFMGRPYDDALASLTGGKTPDSQNLGGPSAVSLAHAAQMLAAPPDAAAQNGPSVPSTQSGPSAQSGHGVRFFGVRGNDPAGDTLEAKFAALPFTGVSLVRKDCPSSRVDVLSDPRYDQGSGERTFVYRRGSLDEFAPEDLTDDFFDAGIIAFGGTALTPRLHDNLTELLKRSRKRGAITEVNLVYDYRSERERPGRKWPLGINDDAYGFIDLLLADQEEALKTSGKPNAEEAAAWFLSRGCGAAVITRGRQPLLLCASGTGPFIKTALTALPVCEEVNRELAARPERRGDTTGCGDNFAGQVLAGLAEAAAPGRGNISLREICVPAVAAGGFACFIVGGAYYEKERGEKRRLLEPYIEAYRKQLGGSE